MQQRTMFDNPSVATKIGSHLNERNACSCVQACVCGCMGVCMLVCPVAYYVQTFIISAHSYNIIIYVSTKLSATPNNLFT